MTRLTNVIAGAALAAATALPAFANDPANNPATASGDDPFVSTQGAAAANAGLSQAASVAAPAALMAGLGMVLGGDSPAASTAASTAFGAPGGLGRGN